MGPFLFQSTGAYQEHEVHVDQHQGHLYTSPRGVVLEPATGSSSVSTQLALTGGDDAAEVIIEGGGRVRFTYEWDTPFDVTENGTYDRVEVAYDSVTPGAYFSFGIGDQSAFCGAERYPGTGPGVVSWPLDFCAGLVDPTAATAMVLYCSPAGSEEAVFEITDVRLMRSGAVVADIESHFVDSMVPPMPSPPLTWISEVSQRPLFHAGLVFENVDNGGYVPELAADLLQENFHGGQILRSTATWHDDVEPGNVDCLVAIDLNTADGLTPEIVFPPDPIIGPMDVSFLTGIEVSDDGGVVRGTSMVRLLLTVDPAQDYDIADVQASVAGSGGLVQNRLEISFRLEAAAPFAAAAPLFDLVWLADWEGDHLSDAGPPPASGHAAPALTATPNPFNPRTTFSLAVPPSGPFTVEIFDARGRRVRELEGADHVVWDGRDHRGRELAAGVYLALARTPEGTALRRVALVR